jgi:hypothetical protein
MNRPPPIVVHQIATKNYSIFSKADAVLLAPLHGDLSDTLVTIPVPVLLKVEPADIVLESPEGAASFDRVTHGIPEPIILQGLLERGDLFACVTTRPDHPSRSHRIPWNFLSRPVSIHLGHI